MSVRSFRPVIAVATVAAAALSCYLVSLRVATERASLEDVETRIVLAQRDIRSLQTEIGTRGRLEQLERWNVKVLALAAPKADQFVDGGYQLARLARPSDEVHMDAPVVLASAPRREPARPLAADASAPVPPAPRPQPTARDGAAGILHVASFEVPASRAPRGPAATDAKPDAPERAREPKPAHGHEPPMSGALRDEAAH